MSSFVEKRKLLDTQEYDTFFGLFSNLFRFSCYICSLPMREDWIVDSMIAVLQCFPYN